MLGGLERVILACTLCVGLTLSQQQQDPPCPEVKFVMYYAHIQYGGQIVPNLVPTFHDCLAVCKDREEGVDGKQACLGVSYDKYWHTCFIHTQDNIQGSILRDECCIHARKACVKPSSTDAPPRAKNGHEPTPKIEVGKEPPPPYDIGDASDSNVYQGGDYYGNRGYDYYYYDDGAKGVDVSDQKEGGVLVDVVDVEVGNKPVNQADQKQGPNGNQNANQQQSQNAGPQESQQLSKDIQDDVVQSRSTLPPTKEPTTKRPSNLVPTTAPQQARNGQPAIEATSIPSVLSAETPPSRVFTSFSKFSKEQIARLVRLGVINFALGLPDTEAEAKAKDNTPQEAGSENRMTTTEPKTTTKMQAAQGSGAGPTQGPTQDPAQSSEAGPTQGSGAGPTQGSGAGPTQGSGARAQDFVAPTPPPAAAPKAQGAVTPRNPAAAAPEGSGMKPSNVPQGPGEKQSDDTVPTLRPGLFQQGIGKPFGLNLNLLLSNQEQAGPPGMNNFVPVTRPQPTNAPGMPDGEDAMGPEIPTTPGMEKTTRPSLLSPPPIPDNGKCPDPFELVPMTAAGGGILLDDVYDKEVCKRRCMEDPACRACDFNNERLECYLHVDGELQIENVRLGSAPCCNHYRKTQCSNTCYQHIPVNAMGNDNAECIRLAPEYELIGLLKTKCPGLCGLAEIISISADGTQMTDRSIFRHCNNNPRLTKPGCITDQTISPVDGHRTFTLTCSCQGTRCNGLATMPLMASQLHLPLDHSVDDTSPFSRHGTAYNISYSSYDSQMVNGAVFNGSACIKVRPLIGFLYGSLQAYQADKQIRLTITMWIKRTEPSGYMSLLSTGPREGPIDLVSIGAGGTHIIQGSVAMASGKRFVTTASAALDEWVFIAFVVGQSDTTPGVPALKLYVGDQDLANGQPSAAVDLTPELLQGTTSPLYLGAKPSLSSASLINFFKGTMDEVRMFSDVLPPKHLQSVRDAAREEAPVPPEDNTTMSDMTDTTEDTTDTTGDFTDSTDEGTTWMDEMTTEALP